MSAIFISFSTKDYSTAREVHDDLREAGYGAVFIAPHGEDGIVAGSPWEQVLYHRLRCCEAVVAICSANSLASKWCFAEIALTLAMRKQVFPIKLDDLPLPEILQQSQSVELRTNVADDPGWTDKDRWLPRLLAGLERAGIPKGRWERNRPPYPGLEAFDEHDAAVFFGRNRIASELEAALIERRSSPLAEGQGRWVLVTGQSGSGKSSLVRAGLMPRLRADPPKWLPLRVMRPADQPFEQLSLAFADIFQRLGGRCRRWEDIRESLQQGNLTPVSDDITSLRALVEQPEATLVVVIDQFEELLGVTQRGAGEFLTLLRGLSALPGQQVCVCATLRSDFLGAFESHQALRHLGQRHVAVEPLRQEDLRGVIEGPALLAGIEIEDQLVDRLVQETAADAATPFLAFALRELYETLGASARWTLQGYVDRVGSLREAVSTTAAEVLARELGDSKAELSRDVCAALLSLVSIDQDGRTVRRRSRWAELPESTHVLIEAFVSARLLVSGCDATSGSGKDPIDASARYVEVTHEALFLSWPVFIDLIARNSAFLEWRTLFQQSFRGWVEAPAEEEAFATAAMIRNASEYRDAGLFLPGDLETRYLGESIQYQRAEQGQLHESIFPEGLHVLLFEPGQRLHLKFKRRGQNYRHVVLVPFSGALLALALWSHLGTRAGNSWFVVAFLTFVFVYACYDQFRAIVPNPVLELDLFQRRANVRGGSPKGNLTRPREGDVLVAVGKNTDGFYARVLYAYEYEIVRSPPAATRDGALRGVFSFARTLNRAMGLHGVRVVEDSVLLEPDVVWKNPGRKQ